MELYTNGTILTMAEPLTAEAVLTDGGIIRAVGARAVLEELAPGARLIDLQGHTMLPAFLDPHSHLSSYASSFLQVPLEECITFEEIRERIRTFMENRGIRPGQWITAKGYDHNRLAEGHHPDCSFLDSCAPENPLVLQHASGHVGVLNSLALRELGITEDTPCPEGGRIGKEEGRLTGYLEENAFFVYLKKIPAPDMGMLLDAYRKAQEGYAARGITTIQEGMAVSQMIPLYRQLIGQDALFLDVVAYAAMQDANAFFEAFPESVKQYHRNMKIGGYKIFLDGSPQGRTAWMRTPYLGGEEDYCGYGTMTDEAVRAAVERAAGDRMQILAHCNGDAAAQQYLEAIDSVSRTENIRDCRPVMIHAQLLGRDQLPQVKKLGVLPSFFVAHVYHWGDVHIENFGWERASCISPTASALQESIRFTFHQDTPVIEPDMLETVWCAVCRQTKSGKLLGEEERISVLEALKAVTINAAWQYFEEEQKGSIEPGKQADFVILDRSPLDASPGEIRDIRVLATIRRGELIYRK